MSTPDYTASELAERFALTVHGDGSARVQGVATLATAGNGQLAFLANPRYRSQLADSRASIVVLRAEDAESAPHTALVAKDPYTAFAKISALFEVLPPSPVPRLMVTNSRTVLRSPITSLVRSPLNFLSCGSPPMAA